MSVRLLLTDSIWKRIEKVLNEIKSKVGRPPDISDRMFIEAVLYIARTGIPCGAIACEAFRGEIYPISWVISLRYTIDYDAGN